MCGDSEMFGGRVSVEEIGIDNVDVASFVEKVLTHDAIVELSGSSFGE